MEEVINYGWLSLIPAVVAVVLAFATRNVVLSLAISLFLGIMIQVGANPWLSLQHLFSDYLFVDLATDNNPQTIVMMATVGGFVALIEKSGGARAFAKAVANSVNSKVKAQLAAWLGGLVIFFSDSGNSLILGPMFRPIFDRLKASRAKLSYILDSTSSPVCILIPITGWGVYIMSIIATEFETLGINGSDASTFMAAIPYQFYSILALFLIPIVAFGRHDFGFMAKAEEQARLGLPQNIADDEAILVSDDKKVSPWNMILPLVILLGTILVMFVSWGFPFQNIPGSKIRIALTSGYLLASIVCMIMITAQKLMSFKETFDVFIGGIQKMGSVLVRGLCLQGSWNLSVYCGFHAGADHSACGTRPAVPGGRHYLLCHRYFLGGHGDPASDRHQYGRRFWGVHPHDNWRGAVRLPVWRPLLAHFRYDGDVRNGCRM